MVIGPSQGVLRLGRGHNYISAAQRAYAAGVRKEATMRATWAVMAVAVLLLIACLAGGTDRRCYDCAAARTFDPARSVRVVILRPLLEAAAALDATADW